jgi:anti-anti-sigma regulatory factor
VLVLLQAWARVVGIQFKLFDPSPVVRQSLQRLGSTAEFEIALTDDVLSLVALGRTEERNHSIAK